MYVFLVGKSYVLVWLFDLIDELSNSATDIL